MKMRGEFTIIDPSGENAAVVVPNLITKEGAIALLESLFHNKADNLIWTGTNPSFYIGLCNETASKAKGMADITTEPPAANGYARQEVTRVSTSWTQNTAVNAEGMKSVAVTFAAVGGDFTAISRIFLCGEDTQDGSGILFSFSGALPSPVIIADGQSRIITYNFYLE